MLANCAELLPDDQQHHNWLQEIADLKLANPRIEKTPLFQQHYLGRSAPESRPERAMSCIV